MTKNRFPVLPKTLIVGLWAASVGPVGLWGHHIISDRYLHDSVLRIFRGIISEALLCRPN